MCIRDRTCRYLRMEESGSEGFDEMETLLEDEGERFRTPGGCGGTLGTVD